MRLLLLFPHPFFQNRGTPIADRALLEVLAGRGNEIDVLTFPEGEDPGVPGVRIHRVGRIPGFDGVPPGFSFRKALYDVLLLFRCAALVRRRKPDLIHAVEESALIAAVVGGFHRTPYVYDMDSSIAAQMIEKLPALGPLRRLFEAFERIAVRRSIAVVAVCPALERIAIAHDPAKPVHPIEDFSLLRDEQPGSAEDLRGAIGAARDDPLVLYVGNLERYQGIDLLLDAFARARRTVPAAQLVLIGGKPADVARYRRKAVDLGLADAAHLLGPRPVDDLAGLLGQADLLVSPRIQGINTPMKIFSYLDSGRPLLATRLPTHTQVLDEEIAGLADPAPEPFAAEMARILEDRDLGTMLAKMARLRVREQYSRDAFQRKMGAFYDHVERMLARAEGAR
ncbi:MAG: glycosyltransferase [Candidatus Eisenbacteria bacterium]|nr:glycosyltransferase [Candidatus Latescibacterota bacterium]MBD3302472.1 glycosyltransferase [Candidatus Eisenbacteria bacterium]